jgi:cytochrome c551
MPTLRMGLALVLLTACAGVPLPREQISDPGQLLFDGYTKPKVDCFHCHNGDGRGRNIKGPSLADRVPKLSDADLKSVIVTGEGLMPGFQDELSDEELGQITRWLRQAFPKT